MDYRNHTDERDKLVEDRSSEKQKISQVIDEYASEMKARAFQKVDEGYIGWDTAEGWIHTSALDRLFNEVGDLQHIRLDDATFCRKSVDVANFAMFAWNLRRHKLPSGQAPIEPSAPPTPSLEAIQTDHLGRVPCTTCKTPLFPNEVKMWEGQIYCWAHYHQAQKKELRPSRNA